MSESQRKTTEVPGDLEKVLQKNDSNPRALTELLQRCVAWRGEGGAMAQWTASAETLVAEQIPEKHEHTPLNKKMSDFVRRNSMENQK
ncbi:hypothetical protein cyc_02448 [Cyclospora cayetanensis]|uniref:Uncharacterized protein n=1 Tax=Cyclospora cayetanensis TaxID=88456 RepID=A0A1D3D8N4_9EIME|nr:hypothetical protein cyc_02448 [Cyclospora cayetanensis]